ncbi:unnamed protein product, partial [Polarella glacialis]
EQSRERPDRISTTARPTREFGSKTPVGASGPIGGSAAFAAPSPKEGKQVQGRGREVREQIEDDPVGYRVFVGQLHPKVQQAELQEVFEKFGAISTVRQIPNKGIAYITYVSEEDSKRAIEGLHGNVIPARSSPNGLNVMAAIPKTYR